MLEGEYRYRIASSRGPPLSTKRTHRTEAAHTLGRSGVGDFVDHDAGPGSIRTRPAPRRGLVSAPRPSGRIARTRARRPTQDRLATRLRAIACVERRAGRSRRCRRPGRRARRPGSPNCRRTRRSSSMPRWPVDFHRIHRILRIRRRSGCGACTDPWRGCLRGRQMRPAPRPSRARAGTRASPRGRPGTADAHA
jgi:hypothetical protein